MKKTGILKRIIAGVLCAVTVLSLGTVAMMSASAAKAGEVEVSKYGSNTLYYSDEYFRHSSTEYDPHLATLSCIMTAFSVPLENPKSLSDENWYNKLNKNERIFSNGAALTRSDLYACTFEAPQGANYNSKVVKKPGDPIYNNIFNIAHLEAQDSYYVDAYNAKNSNKISLVPLRASADFGRVKFKDYNDISLYSGDASKCFVKVKGAKGAKSIITKCEKGFAVGCYTYMTEEKMELFMPVGQKYFLNMMSYSIKPEHTVSYLALYQSVSSNSDHRIRNGRGGYNDWFCFNSDYLQRMIDLTY